MPRFPTRSDDAVAVIDAASGERATYHDIRERARERASELAPLSGGLAFLGVTPTITTVVDLLALLEAEVGTALIDPTLDPAVIDDWVGAYRPELVVGFGGPDRCAETGDPRAVTEPAEAILLATSGSTGNPKFVRLSLDNVLSNARQIAEALHIGPDHRGFAHLPLFYSYGLSVLTSHLHAGASVVLSGASAIRPEFWQAMNDHEVTSLPGVPYNFEIYRRMKLTERDLPHLRDVTQAGGRLNPERIDEFRAGFADKGVRFWIMYGQTEATARIAVLPADELDEHVGSVGYPLPDGVVEIADPDENGVGEIVYRGPNVMLGYAKSRADLATGDELGGRLATGDVGRLDDRGRLWITGRTKRIAKVTGVRVNLDDVERQLAEIGLPLAAVDSEGGITVYYESTVEVEKIDKRCERLLKLPPRTVQAVRLDRLPTTSAGKIAYQELIR